MNKSKLPEHIGIIMDGNGRWARNRDLPRVKGHEEGASTVREITECCAENDIQELTLFAFSRDNWKRPDQEIDFLMNLLKVYLDREYSTIMDNDIIFRTIGRTEELPGDVQDRIQNLINESRENSGMILRLALNYGGKQELLDATRQIAKKVQNGELTPEEIDESTVQNNLYDPDMRDPDLFIRTGGEKRISNFLLWQLTYTEIFFTSTYWPDFDRDDLMTAISSFQERERRFGGLQSKESETA